MRDNVLVLDLDLASVDTGSSFRLLQATGLASYQEMDNRLQFDADLRLSIESWYDPMVRDVMEWHQAIFDNKNVWPRSCQEGESYLEKSQG